MDSRPPSAGKKTHIAVIKIVAILLVMFNHTGNKGFLLFSVAQNAWTFPIYLFLSIFCKMAVPLFFMCSGALLLGKDEPFKRLFTHRILRYLVVLILFSAIFYVFSNRTDLSKLDLDFFFAKLYSSQITTSYWFLYAYLAALIMLPLIRKLARALNGKEIAYFIALQVVFVGVIPVLEYLACRKINQINIRLDMLAQNIFFMVIGYWVENRLDIGQVKPGHLAVGTTAGALCIGIACVMTVYKGHIDGKYTAELSQTFHSGLIAVPTIAVYVLLKYLVARGQMSETFNHVVLYLGDLTFGIYLVHMVFMNLFTPVLNAVFPVLRSLPSAAVWMALSLLASGIVTAALKRIPVASKLL